MKYPTARIIHKPKPKPPKRLVFWCWIATSPQNELSLVGYQRRAEAVKSAGWERAPGFTISPVFRVEAPGPKTKMSKP